MQHASPVKWRTRTSSSPLTTVRTRSKRPISRPVSRSSAPKNSTVAVWRTSLTLLARQGVGAFICGRARFRRDRPCSTLIRLSSAPPSLPALAHTADPRSPMARILVQTSDRRTVLDERHVRLTDIVDKQAASGLLDRLEAAIRHAERLPRRREARPRRVASIVSSVADYRDIGA